MRKLFLLLSLCLLLTVPVFAADATITSMKTDCRVDASGTTYVTQTLTLDLPTMESELDFPLGENVSHPEIAGYNAKKYTADGVTGLRLSSSTGITGVRTFTITYELRGLASEADGVQTFTLPLLCGRWSWPIEHYDFTVSMPKEFSGSPSFASGYQGDAIEGYMTYSIRELMISGSMNETLKDQDSLRMTLAREVVGGLGGGGVCAAADRAGARLLGADAPLRQTPRVGADAPARLGAARRRAVSSLQRAHEFQHARLPLGKPWLPVDVCQ